MIIIRPITFKDLEAYEQLAMQSSAGIFNLPKNRALLQKKIQDSLLAFSSHGSQAENEVYVFVLEDLDTGIVGGTCGIISKTAPMHFYRLETVKQHSDHFPLAPEIKILHPMTDKKKVSEICSLYLHPKFRKDGLGKLISFSRLWLLIQNALRKRLSLSCAVILWMITLHFGMRLESILST
jgi:arginine N-succinyltransferase